MNRVFQHLKRWTSHQDKAWCFPVLLALLAFAITLINALRSAYPIGYAGLYTLMFEGIAENGLRLPATLPYYNLQPIPFAYPPLPFYVAAIITQVFGISSLAYLRFIPIPLAVGCGLAFYFLLVEIVKDPRIAALGGVLFLSMPEIAHYDFSAAGMVRGLALLFLLLFWLFFWRTFYTAETRRRESWLAGLFLALTGLSHLSYLLFAGFGVVLMAVFSDRAWKQKAVHLLRVGLVALVLLSPWLVHILSRWGFDILIAPLASHDNLQLSQGLLYVLRIANLNPPWIMALFLVAFLHALTHQRWLWVSWFLLTLVGFGESDRFLLLLLIVMAAEFLVFWLEKIPAETDLKPQQRWIPLGVIALAVIGLAIPNYITLFRQQQASLTDEFIEMGTWLKENTPQDAEVLYIESDPALSEWLPYFSHRVPETGHWGTEWLGSYAEESEQQFLVRGIAVNEDNELLVESMRHFGWDPEFTVLPKKSELTTQYLEHTKTIVFENEEYLVVEMP